MQQVLWWLLLWPASACFLKFSLTLVSWAAMPIRLSLQWLSKASFGAQRAQDAKERPPEPDKPRRAGDWIKTPLTDYLQFD
jgi:hypothetical protein